MRAQLAQASGSSDMSRPPPVAQLRTAWCPSAQQGLLATYLSPHEVDARVLRADTHCVRVCSLPERKASERALLSIQPTYSASSASSAVWPSATHRAIAASARAISAIPLCRLLEYRQQDDSAPVRNVVVTRNLS